VKRNERKSCRLWGRKVKSKRKIKERGKKQERERKAERI
jgi:hypothetical protein